MSAAAGGGVDILADLRGVVRIAKAASIGVTGNGPRIERAEAAIQSVAELVKALQQSDEWIREAKNLGCTLSATTTLQANARALASIGSAR